MARGPLNKWQKRKRERNTSAIQWEALMEQNSLSKASAREEKKNAFYIRFRPAEVLLLFFFVEGSSRWIIRFISTLR
jgi:hypothetical protein